MFLDGVHVPMIVRYPDGYLAGERPPVTVSHVDIVPTVLDVTGFEVDDMLSGHSLRGDVSPDRIVRADKGVHYTLVQWPRKMISNGTSAIVSIYDLEEDPLELSPEKGRPAFEDFEAAFTAQYAERPFVRYAPVFATKKMPKKLQDKLEALGYAGEVGDD